MPTLRLIKSRIAKRPLASRPTPVPGAMNVRLSSLRAAFSIPAPAAPGSNPNGIKWPNGKGEFFRSLSGGARRDFETLAHYFHCSGADILIAEEQKPITILFLLEGEANISMNSLDGKRFLLGVARAGDVIGLASAISGCPSEIRVEANFPCKIAGLYRQDFLDFLLNHPNASQNVARELSALNTRLCERLRILGLTTSVPIRLARLLLEWCKDGHLTKNGTHIRCTLTQAEIGECIGSSRESVTRTLTDLKNQGLLRLAGSTLIVPDRLALALFAGIDSPPGSDTSAA
jgi:CRP/FNR family cyclic AMP-dependent transcriptional regulator